MGDYYFATPVGPFPTAVGTAANTFTTRQDITPQPLPLMLPSALRAGSRIWLKANGEFSTTGTPTLALGFFIGTNANPSSITTDIALSSVITTCSGAAAWPWEMEWQGIVTSVVAGATNNVTGSGELKLGTSLTAWTSTPIPITQALRTFTWDATIVRAIGVSATWGTSSASNSIKCNTMSVQLQN